MEKPTEKDEQLIAKALRMKFSDFDKVDEMAQQADTEYARERLLRIAHDMYHLDEAKADCQ